jgi:hypothetical protein
VLQSAFGDMIPAPMPPGITIHPRFHAGNFVGVKLAWSRPEEAPGTMIVVNGSKKIVMTDALSYSDVVTLAIGTPLPARLPMLTVTYKSTADEGILTDGQRVMVVPGMIFDACHTGNA